MKQTWIFLLALVFAGAAQAQYRWVDQDGKTRYGDTPPPGVKATRLGAPASGTAAVAPAAASKDAKKGPLTPAEQEQEFRKRQDQAKKDQEKAAKEREYQGEKKEDCARTREYIRTLESGQRVSRTDANGERYYMDDSQTAQELSKARQALTQVCN